MMPFTQDFTYFFTTIYGGIIIGLLFDIYRVLKMNSKILKYLHVFLDIIFWTISTTLIFITINTIESFELRYYHFIALFIGFILYYNTISKPILTITNKIISFISSLLKKVTKYIVNILENLYYVIVYSLHFVFDIIFYIPNIILSIYKKITLKSRRRLKIKN